MSVNCKKVIHNAETEKQEKSSYTRSYSHYPQTFPHREKPCRKRFSTLCTGFSTGRKRSFTPEQKGEYNLHNVKM